MNIILVEPEMIRDEKGHALAPRVLLVRDQGVASHPDSPFKGKRVCDMFLFPHKEYLMTYTYSDPERVWISEDLVTVSDGAICVYRFVMHVFVIPDHPDNLVDHKQFLLHYVGNNPYHRKPFCHDNIAAIRAGTYDPSTDS
jgi:hypothetical protein